MSDELLARTHFIITAMGKKIYEDLSLIAISDGSYPYILFPNITFIKDSGRKLGKRAVSMLIDLIDENGSKVKMQTLLKTKLVELNSVKDIKIIKE
jgi:DNA-binding LacI/PurR family transcriptional regulator